jgi:fucose permease
MIICLVPSFTAAVISVSIIGILLGPMFPITINHAARVLPRHLMNGAVGWMSACGSGGSAILPFITGAIASNWGIESLQFLCVFQSPDP